MDRALAASRHYPAISWLDSYSEYIDEVRGWWDSNSDNLWYKDRQTIMSLLHKEVHLLQVVKLVGSDALPDSQNFILEVCALFKNAFLQQNAFDDMDKFCEVKRQVQMLHLVIRYNELGRKALKNGVTLVKVKRLKVVQRLYRMRSEKDLGLLGQQLETSMKKLGAMYD